MPAEHISTKAGAIPMILVLLLYTPRPKRLYATHHFNRRFSRTKSQLFRLRLLGDAMHVSVLAMWLQSTRSYVLSEIFARLWCGSYIANEQYERLYTPVVT